MSWEITISLLIVIGGTSTVLDNILGDVSVNKIKDVVITWWVNLEEVDVSKITKLANKHLVDFFVIFYGKRHLSYKCFSRSVFTSVFFLTLLLVMYFTFTDYSGELMKSVPSHVTLTSYLIFWVVAGLIFNIVIDYISLVETRIILNMVLENNIIFVIIALIFDFVFSITLFVFGVLLSYSCLVFIRGGDSGDVVALISALWIFINGDIFTPVYTLHAFTPFTYSTMLTSIIFYLFVISSIVISILNSIKIPIVKLFEWFASKPKPITAISGIVAGIVLTSKGIQGLWHLI